MSLVHPKCGWQRFAMLALLCTLLPGSSLQQTSVISTTPTRTNTTTPSIDDPLYLYDDAVTIAANGIGDSCTSVQVDALCSTSNASANLRDAVVMILLDDEGSTCSGTLINAPSGRPTVLTAFHCLQDMLLSASVPDASVPLPFNDTDPNGEYVNDPYIFTETLTSKFFFAFNFQRACTNSSASSTLSRFQGVQLLQGAIPLYGNAATDIMVLELLDDIPTVFTPYYMGWSSYADDVPSSLMVVHHPNGDMKKISVVNNAPKTVSSKDITIAVEAKGEGNYFLVPSWDSGTMEPGSSGSALVDANNMTVVGTLTGTPTRSACSRSVPTVFAKLSTAWQLYGLWEALGGDGPNSPMRMPGVRPDTGRLQLQVAPDVINVKDRRSAPRAELIVFKVTGSFQPNEQIRITLNLTSTAMNDTELASVVGSLRTTSVTVSRNNTYFNATLDVGPLNLTGAVFKPFKLNIIAQSTTDPSWSEQRGLVGYVGPSPTAGYSYRDPVRINRLPYKYAIPSIDNYAGTVDNLCELLKTQQLERNTFSQCQTTSGSGSGGSGGSGSIVSTTVQRSPSLGVIGRRLQQTNSGSVADIINSVIGALGPGNTGDVSGFPSTTTTTTFPPSTTTTFPPPSTTTTTFPPSSTTTTKPSGPQGLVFIYTPPTDQSVDISTCPDSAIDTFLFLIQAGPTTTSTRDQKLVAYNDDASQRVTCSTIKGASVKGGTSYFVVVAQNNAYIGTEKGALPVTLTMNVA